MTMTETTNESDVKLHTPETIYLLEMDENEWTWCDVPDPDYSDRKTVKYIRADHTDHLLEMAVEALREIMPTGLVHGDAIHRTNPTSKQVVNSNIAWLVTDGERSGYKLQVLWEKAQQTLLTLQQHGYGKE